MITRTRYFVTDKRSIVQVLSRFNDRIEKVKQKDLKTEFILAVGSPSEEITAIPRSEGIGLIIVGSMQLKGKDKIKSLGSVSRKVSEAAPCPVMILH